MRFDTCFYSRKKEKDGKLIKKKRKTRDQFTVLAEYYDRFNGADYKLYADYVENVFKKHGSGKEELLLDLACGTGRLTEELAERGYDMIGADVSEDMLSVAMSGAYEKELSILYLKQDMREFELYGTVDAVICSLDGISYLAEKEDTEKCLRLIRNYLNPGALLLFDINSDYRFKEILAKRDFFLEEEGAYLGWKSELDEKKSVCYFNLTFFTENGEGGYVKSEETQCERVWEKEEICGLISACGLEVIDIYGDLNMKKTEETDEKWYFVCRCPFNK